MLSLVPAVRNVLRQAVRSAPPASGTACPAAGRNVRFETLEARKLLSTYHLSFSDEFNTLDLATSPTDTGWGVDDYYGNKFVGLDQQYYANPATDNYNPFSIDNGILKITAAPKPANFNVSTGKNYVSGQLSTVRANPWGTNTGGVGFSQKYGYFEVRAKMPSGSGFWPAFWLMPANGQNHIAEYDVVETLGKYENRTFQTVHWNNYANNQGNIYTGINTTTGFNNYGMEWTPTELKWYVNGVHTFTQPNRSNTPMHMLLNMAVGGWDSNNPNASTDWTRSMEVDYVRVYSNDPAVPEVTPGPGYSPSPFLPIDIGDDTEGLTLDRWNNIPGSAISDIPLTTTPDSTTIMGSLEIPTNTGNNYGVRARGYLEPDVTGNYTFWIAGDDHTQLWLSTDDTEANAQLIASHTSWTSSRQWNKFGSQQSVEISLVGGQRYFIEARMKENAGGDNMAVSWKLNDTTDPANGDGSYIISAANLAPWDGGTVNVSGRIEAEDFSASNNVSVNNGATGQYVGYPGIGSGSWAEWDDLGVSGEVDLTFSYSNGHGSSKSMRLLVNGVIVKTLNFTPTGSWGTWQDLTTTIDLNPGDVVRLLAHTGSGGPRLDYIDVDGQAATPVEYTEPFPNATGTHVSLGSVGWKAHFGTGGTAYSPSNTSTSAGPTVAGFSGYDGVGGLLYQANVNRNTSNIWWTEEQSFGNITGIDTISFNVRNSSSVENLRVALRVGGNWYVSDQTFNSPDANNWVARTLNVSTAQFRALGFNPGSALPTSPAGSTTTLSSGEVTAVGIYTGDLVSTIRVDNFRVNGGGTNLVVEPPLARPLPPVAFDPRIWSTKPVGFLDRPLEPMVIDREQSEKVIS
ncbi:MAG: family 16 glycosylhydrolase [Phycisphaerae bacterium]